MATVVPIDQLRVSPTAALFEGGDEVAVSVFMTAYPRREMGPDLHLHPYPEVFVVQSGTARFTAAGEQVVVEAGNVVVVPADTAHGFKNAGEGELRVLSVHPSAAVQQTDL